MKKIYFVLLLIPLIFCKCDNTDRVPIYLYVYKGDLSFNDSIHLWIDNSLIYEGKYRGNISIYNPMIMGYMKKDTLTKQIRIKIDDHDTTFIHKQKENMDNVIIRYLHYPYEPYRFSIDTVRILLD